MGAELIVRTSAFLLTRPGFYADRSLSGMRPARLTRALLPQCSDLIQLARRGGFPLRGFPRRGGLGGAARLPGASGAAGARARATTRAHRPEPRLDPPADGFRSARDTGLSSAPAIEFVN